MKAEILNEGYYNDPRKNIHSIYVKEMIINPFMFNPIKEFGFDALCAPDDFDRTIQTLDIYALFCEVYKTDKTIAGIHLISNSADSNCPIAVYKWGEEISGVSYTHSHSLPSFALGSTKRYIITDENSHSNSTFNCALGSTWIVNNTEWIYFKSYPVVNLANCKYIHCEDIDAITSFTGSGAYGCSYLLGTFTIPDNMTYIGSNFFGYCVSITKVVFGKSISFIGNRAFWFMSLLTGDIVLPASLTQIDEYAFYADGQLNGALYINATNALIDINTFSGMGTMTALHLCAGYNSAYMKFDFSQSFSADSLNQSIINITSGTKTLTIGGSNKARLLAAYPNAEANANARGITVN